MQEAFLTCSEIGDYVYCPLSWLLKRLGWGVKSKDMKKGEVYHRRHQLKKGFLRRA